MRSACVPQPVPDPRLAAVSCDAFALIGVVDATLDDEALRDVTAGAVLPVGSSPCALGYAGHQFGSYVAQLGDGRACLLGDVGAEADQSDGLRWEIQLKGSGPTAYSRGFDGRAVLRSSVREYLASEAMAGLGIATTRALSLVVSPLNVYREDVEPAAVLMRMARSHIRFGSFQYLAQFGGAGARADLECLAESVIERSMDHLDSGDYGGLLACCVERTAALLAAWQCEGFAHGVMNTDNMSIDGDTIDYGPYAFIDTFDPTFTPNTTDVGGRYAFGRQPSVALWNLGRLAEALVPILDREQAQAAVDRYAEQFNDAFSARMRRKLGLDDAEPSDEELITDLLATLASGRGDYAAFFRRLCDYDPSDASSRTTLCATLADPRLLDSWLARYDDRLTREGARERSARMRRANPLYVLKNWVAQYAIERVEAGDDAELERLRVAFSDPYCAYDGLERFSVLADRPHSDTKLGCSS